METDDTSPRTVERRDSGPSPRRYKFERVQVAKYRLTATHNTPRLRGPHFSFYSASLVYRTCQIVSSAVEPSTQASIHRDMSPRELKHDASGQYSPLEPSRADD